MQKALYLLGTYYNLFVIVDGSSSSTSSSSLIGNDDAGLRKFVRRIRNELLNESNDDDDDDARSTNIDDDHAAPTAVGGGYRLNPRVLPPHRIAFSSTSRGRVAFVRQLQGTELVIDHDELGVTSELERFGFRVLVYPNDVGGGDDGKEYSSALGKFLVPL